MSFKTQLLITASAAVFFFSPYSSAQQPSSDTQFNQCVIEQVNAQPDNTPIGDIESHCRQLGIYSTDLGITLGPISQRIIRERQAKWNRHVLTAYRQNYYLFYTHSDTPNREAYEDVNDWSGDIRHEESMFQVSFKIPLNSGDVFKKHDGLYFGVTVKSWWQIYASEISRPFRETNYEPEVFYIAPLKSNVLGGNTGFKLGLSHQSNGRSQLLSRSWNRIYGALLFEKDDFAISIRPWYRFQEKQKASRFESEGDDNPNIEQYMGDFDIRGAKRFKGNNELSFLFRNNCRQENRGAIEVGFSFSIPRQSHLKGFIQYFNGYGESLIDHKHHQERIGVGVLLTDWL